MNKTTYLSYLLYTSIFLLSFWTPTAFAFGTPIQRVRLEFNAPDGLIRPLLLGFTTDNSATDGVDNGYDAKNRDNYPNDMSFFIDGGSYIIQGVGQYETSKIYPFALKLATGGAIGVKLTALENFESSILVYIYDSVLDKFYQINDKDMSTDIEAGEYTDRFFITFTNDLSVLNSSNLLSNKELNKEDLRLSFNKYNQLLTVSNSSNSVKTIDLYDFSGRLISKFINSTNDSVEISTASLRTKTLLLAIKFDNGAHITKSIALSD